MKKILIFTALLYSQTLFAEPYIEIGGFFSKDRIWFYNDDGVRAEESGIIGHIATGYEIEYGKFMVDLQVRHESDPKFSNEKDISSKNSAGFAVRYRF